MPDFPGPGVAPAAIPTALPVAAGLGLRAPHHAAVRAGRLPVAWWEVHSENFFAEGGSALDFLRDIRRDYPLSLHGVGLSLGGVDTLFAAHLEKLARLVERTEPAAVSEHLCWSAVGGRHFNDLLPLPYTEAALVVVAERVQRAQERLGRRLLVENVSSYLQWREADYTEWDFVAELVRRTGCGILLDVNNIYVSAQNHGFDALTYLAAMPVAAVGEIHLAGYDECDDFLVDTHGRAVQPPVWALYAQALARFGATPTLIEWDTAIPPLAALIVEAATATGFLTAAGAPGEASRAADCGAARTGSEEGRHALAG